MSEYQLNKVKGKVLKQKLIINGYLKSADAKAKKGLARELTNLKRHELLLNEDTETIFKIERYDVIKLPKRKSFLIFYFGIFTFFSITLFVIELIIFRLHFIIKSAGRIAQNARKE